MIRALAALFVLMGASSAGALDFNRDVRPILSDRCYKCHGPDAKNQKSDFRLDTAERALADLGGYFGIVPGNLKKSELHWRIRSEDEDDRMPPPDSKLELTGKERDVLDQWIKEGAKFEAHWAFQMPTKPKLPAISAPNRRWAKNGIDYFIAAQLEAAGLSPSPEAEKARLIRRVTLDLTGLPPTPAEVDAFLADESPKAYEKVVNRLLKSRHYGERMALPWLDAARYADSGGYQGDPRRTQWPWRDWVIRAYNANLPFDQFSIEQLAGDLLDNPTDDQVLATAFNRNHRINNEGGIIPAEFLVEYVADRVETTSTVWMGLTVGCARCHDHKYDPITQREYYEMYAFFHNIPENGRDGDLAPKPNLAVYTGGTKEEHLALLDRIADLKERQGAFASDHADEFEAWLAEQRAKVELTDLPMPSLHFPLDAPTDRHIHDTRHKSRRGVIVRKGKEPVAVEGVKFGGGLKFGREGYVKAGGVMFSASESRTWSVALRAPAKFTESEGPILAAWDDKMKRGYRLSLEDPGDGKPYRVSFRIYANRREKKGLEVLSGPAVPRKEFVRLAVSYDGSGTAGGIRILVDGQPVETESVLDELEGSADTKSPLLLGARSEADAARKQYDATFRGGEIDDVQIFDVALAPDQVARLHAITPLNQILADEEKPSREYLSRLFFARHHEGSRQLVADLKKTEAGLDRFEKNAITYVSVMKEMPEPRKTYFLERGAYDHPDTSEELQPGTFGALPAFSGPANRLGLARWLFGPEHPLTARVAVNRYWQMYFGTGLVVTPEDFGSQGKPPTHPGLLDWLAVTFRQSGWDVKAMQKLIVMSSSYRQSSRVAPELLGKDPDNRLMARAPRLRLYGQALRDQSLAVSGLLDPAIGGEPVMPYQPEGLWEEVSAKSYKYIVGEGSDLYRRSLYTFWRRTVPPPSMMNFDNTTREICTVRATRTNTPLQAMNLMNDPQFVEAARALAERMMREGGDSAERRIDYGHKLVLAREPDAVVADVLTKGYKDYLKTFRQAPERAQSFVSVGKSQPDESLNVAELAAATAIASILLNLDETMTKE